MSELTAFYESYRKAIHGPESFLIKAAELFHAAGDRPSLEALANIRQILWPEEKAEDQMGALRNCEYANILTKIGLEAQKMALNNIGAEGEQLPNYLQEALVTGIQDLAAKVLPKQPKHWDDIFAVPSEFSDSVLSLDLLTPHFKHDFEKRLSEQQQVVFAHMVRLLSNAPLGSWSAVSEIKDVVGLPGNTVSACLENMIKRGALLGLRGKGSAKKGYRIKNPAAELWLRCRMFGLSKSVRDFTGVVCPVFRDAHRISPQHFWSRFCQESGLDEQTPIVWRRSRGIARRQSPAGCQLS